MIHLIDRNIVFEKYKNLAAEISEMQQAFYDDTYVERFCKTESERNEYLMLFDAKDIQLPEVEKTYNKISFDYSDLKTFSKKLTDKLKELLTNIGAEKFIVLTHYKMPFVVNIDNTYPPLQKVFKKFKAITNHIEYDGAIETDFDSLFDLIDIAFWIMRCDASGPEFIFFHDIEERFSFNVCKYGSIHTIEYKKEYLTREFLKYSGWYFIEDRCFDKFTEDGKIKGRRLKI